MMNCFNELGEGALRCLPNIEHLEHRMLTDMRAEITIAERNRRAQAARSYFATLGRCCTKLRSLRLLAAQSQLEHALADPVSLAAALPASLRTLDLTVDVSEFTGLSREVQLGAAFGGRLTTLRLALPNASGSAYGDESLVAASGCPLLTALSFRGACTSEGLQAVSTSLPALTQFALTLDSFAGSDADRSVLTLHEAAIRLLPRVAQLRFAWRGLEECVGRITKRAQSLEYYTDAAAAMAETVAAEEKELQAAAAVVPAPGSIPDWKKDPRVRRLRSCEQTLAYRCKQLVELRTSLELCQRESAEFGSGPSTLPLVTFAEQFAFFVFQVWMM
jgi:hypothetical protein